MELSKSVIRMVTNSCGAPVVAAKPNKSATNTILAFLRKLGLYMPVPWTTCLVKLTTSI